MTYLADGDVVHAPSTLEWWRTRRDAIGQQLTLREARQIPQWVAFGWLDSEHPYATGSCPAPLVASLEQAASRPLWRTRGYHRCPLCPPGALPAMPGTPYETASGEVLLLGDACLEIRARDKTTWVAPNLVLHYIETHGYLPPDALQGQI